MTAMKAIPIGISNYRELRENDYYFVDKSLMLQDFLKNKSKVTLITRPRRFGKTINMSMMNEFFDITKDSKELFIDTKIMDTPYANEMNQYPTIFISFADAKRDKDTIVSTIKTQIQNQWDKHSYVFENLQRFKKAKYDHLYDVLVQYDNDLTGINDALSFLMERLEDYYGKKVMVFIDEYDTPFIEAHVNGFYDEIKGGLSGLLHNSLKTSDSLKYAMLTGIQRVAKENIFSDLNNLVVYTVLDKPYSQYFGFDSHETKTLLEYYHLQLNDHVKEMYDGYHIGNNDIYNPWSILNYASAKELVPYWVNTSANTMIKQALLHANDGFKREYNHLIINSQLETTVTMQTSFYEVADNATLWGLFVNAGYLTINKVIDLMDNYYSIQIPNKEVQTEFRSLTEYYLSLNEGQLTRLSRYLTHEQQENFINEYQNILMLPSYHDLTNENSYHMMMLGMCVCLSNRYYILSNRETGKGRCDIILKAKDKKHTSFVLEFKYLKEKKDNIHDELNKLACKAIQQIKNNRYNEGLKGKVIYVALAHHGKDVIMKWQEKN